MIVYYGINWGLLGRTMRRVRETEDRDDQQKNILEP